jgi:hypothetical protein
LNNEVTIQSLRELGISFRRAILSIPSEKFINSSWFNNYPRGCCGDTSDLFSKYLNSKGIEVIYVWGFKGEQSHAWLEYHDIIIDLTADQFPDVNEEVVITKRRNWYDAIAIQNKSKNDFESYPAYNSVRLRNIYDNILLELSKQKKT